MRLCDVTFSASHMHTITNADSSIQKCSMFHVPFHDTHMLHTRTHIEPQLELAVEKYKSVIDSTQQNVETYS